MILHQRWAKKFYNKCRINLITSRRFYSLNICIHENLSLPNVPIHDFFYPFQLWIRFNTVPIVENRPKYLTDQRIKSDLKQKDFKKQTIVDESCYKTFEYNKNHKSVELTYDSPKWIIWSRWKIKHFQNIWHMK